MSGPAARTLPGANFDFSGSHLRWMPAELIAQTHRVLIESDRIVIASKSARSGPLAPVLSQDERAGLSDLPGSSFSFSTTYSSSIADKASYEHYREIVQNYIIGEMQEISVNIEDMQFANALKLMRTLEKRGKLSDFYLPRNAAGQPTGQTPARTFVFRHHITKNFPDDAAKRIKKWTNCLGKLPGMVFTSHSVTRFEDNIPVRDYVSSVGEVPRVAKQVEKLGILSALTDRLAIRDEELAAQNRELVQSRNAALAGFMHFQEQERIERARLLMLEENQYEDNEVVYEGGGDGDLDMADAGDVDMEDDNEEDAWDGRAGWGTLRI